MSCPPAARTGPDETGNSSAHGESRTRAAIAAKPTSRALDTLMTDLLGPLLREGALSGGWRVVDWDAEQGINLVLGRGDRLLVVDVDERHPDRPAFVHSERFGLSGRPQFEPPRSLLADEQVLLGELAELLRQGEGRLPQFERLPAQRKSMVREVLVERMLISEGRGHYYLNPYVGCMFGCPYCYVADRADAVRKLSGLPHLPWGSWVDVKSNAIEILGREVQTLPPGVVRISPVVTDPYQAIERHYRLTRGCLEVLAEAGFDAMVLTRAGRIAADIDVLKRLPRALVGLSVPTDDDQMRRRFEPGADPIEARVEALAACASAGLAAVAFVQPMLPMNPERLADLLAPHIKAVRIDRMQAADLARPLYEAHGLGYALEDGWFETTARTLRGHFVDRGVAVDAVEDLAALMTRLAQGAPRAQADPRMQAVVASQWKP